jgi:hypothetical protein
MIEISPMFGHEHGGIRLIRRQCNSGHRQFMKRYILNRLGLRAACDGASALGLFVSAVTGSATAITAGVKCSPTLRDQIELQVGSSWTT